MRNFVEKREAVQRADEAAQRDEQRAANQQSRPPSPRPSQQHGNTDECLRNVESMVLEASQRAQMEADCRNLLSPQPVYAPTGGPVGVPIGIPVGVPVYPQRHHVQPQPAPAPKAEPPSGPPIAIQPLKK